MRVIYLVAAAVSLTMSEVQNKKGSKRCLDYLAEQVFNIPCE
jgi:hypothetical protein